MPDTFHERRRAPETRIEKVELGGAAEGVDALSHRLSDLQRAFDEHIEHGKQAIVLFGEVLESIAPGNTKVAEFVATMKRQYGIGGEHGA